jgi:TonB family protein
VDVSDVLRERMEEPGGLRVTAGLSLLIHVAAVTAMIVGPLRWAAQTVQEKKRPVMTISLGGAGTGPQTSGMTTISARPVQTTEPAPKPEAVRAPAAAVPKMTVPLEKTPPPAKPTKTPPKALENIEKTPDARGTTLARGKELQSGSAVAETGARGQGFGGLSTGGGNGLSPLLDVGNFCCPDYIALMNNRITSNWSQQVEVAGAVVVKMTIQRDGKLTDVALEQTSGYTSLDLNAQRAIQITRQLPPLPAEYPNPTLTIHLTFKYSR